MYIIKYLSDIIFFIIVIFFIDIIFRAFLLVLGKIAYDSNLKKINVLYSKPHAVFSYYQNSVIGIRNILFKIIIIVLYLFVCLS